MLAILYLILTLSIIIFSFSLGRYPFLNPKRNVFFASSVVAITVSLALMRFFNIAITGYEIFLLSLLAIVFFRQGRKRKYLYGSLIFKKSSSGSLLTVEENLSKNIKVMKRDGKILSGVNLSTGEPTSNLYKYPHLTELLPQSTKNILCLGAGACAYPSYAFRMKPKLTFDIVDIDPAVIEAAKKYFLLPLRRQFRLIEKDALAYLKKKWVKKYDLIFVDLGIVVSRLMPEENNKFVDKESLSLYKKALNSTGFLLINIISTLRKEDHDLVSGMLETFKKVFTTHLLFVENPQKDKSQLQDIIHLFSRQKINITSLRKGLTKADENELSYSKFTFDKLIRTHLLDLRSK